MDPTLTVTQRRMLSMVFERGAEDASGALSRWLGRPVHLAVSEVEQLELEEAAGVLGQADALVASCAMELSGRLTGQLLLIFDDDAGLALADLLLRRPRGTSDHWGELERSAAGETTNIVGCAFLNSLAAHLPDASPSDRDTPLIPSPPEFRREFAATLLEFALMDQAIGSDRVLLVRSRFTSDGADLQWSLLFVPSGETLRVLASALSFPEAR